MIEGVLPSEYSSEQQPRARALLAMRRLYARSAVLLMILLAAAATWVASMWGPGQDGYFDSAFYLDGARHLAAGDGFVSAATDATSRELAPVTRWAPGFPFAIAAVSLTLQLPALNAAALVLGAAYVCLVCAVFVLGRLLFGPRHALLAALCAVVAGVQAELLATVDALLSDLPFGALAVTNTAVAVVLARKRVWSGLWVVAFAATLAAMFFVRYAGALYIPGLLIATAIAMLARGQSLRVVAWNHVRVALCVAAGIGAWMARNDLRGELPLGARVVVDSDWHLHADRALRGAFVWWFSLRELAAKTDSHALFACGTVAVCAALGLLLLNRSPRLWEGLGFTLFPALVYGLLMVESASRVKIDAIQHPRFWTPVWSMVFLAGACGVAHAGPRWRQVIASVVVVGLLGVGVGETSQLLHDLPQAQHARGLLVAPWKAAAAALPDPELCRLFATDVRPVMLHRRLGPSSEIPTSMAELNEAARHHKRLCFAVFSKSLRVSTTAERRRIEQDKVIAALRASHRLELLWSRAHVTVYRLRDDAWE